jgi:hypothetical protein
LSGLVDRFEETPLKFYQYALCRLLEIQNDSESFVEQYIIFRLVSLSVKTFIDDCRMIRIEAY